MKAISYIKKYLGHHLVPLAILSADGVHIPCNATSLPPRSDEFSAVGIPCYHMKSLSMIAKLVIYKKVETMIHIHSL